MHQFAGFALGLYRFAQVAAGEGSQRWCEMVYGASDRALDVVDDECNDNNKSDDGKLHITYLMSNAVAFGRQRRTDKVGAFLQLGDLLAGYVL